VRDNFVGTPERVAEQVQGFVDAGCREFVLWFRDFPSSESLERFAAEVVPKISV
jgi:alkanesulfonate monooxygenase SsuD/methylene tetrahydromethanopterin reductase-like flavin-dependent oxidoreductase (luciferase family)